MKKTETLTDTSFIPFGKYARSKTRMQDVPVSYLHYLWTNGMEHENSPVANYIRENLSSLETENNDLIWGRVE